MVARSYSLAYPVSGTRPFHVIIGPRTRQRRIGGWIGLAFTLAAVFFIMISTRVALDRNAFVLEDIRNQISVEEARYWGSACASRAAIAGSHRRSCRGDGHGVSDPVGDHRGSWTGQPRSRSGGSLGRLKMLLSAQP